MHHTATHCNTLQCTATHCSALQQAVSLSTPQHFHFKKAQGTNDQESNKLTMPTFLLKMTLKILRSKVTME